MHSGSITNHGEYCAFDGYSELSKWVDAVMLAEAGKFLSEVPRASHLTDDTPLDVNYYVRHRIEAVWRIWLTAKTDALSLVKMLDEDYDASRPWSAYIAEELDHDVLFLSDLNHHGVTEAQVRQIGPFSSTRKMVAEIESGIQKHGSLPAVAYSLFVEWNADRYSGRAVDKARACLPTEYLNGAKQHAEFDIAESHFPMILEITGRLIAKDSGRITTLEKLIREIALRFREYFTELHHSDLAFDKPSAQIPKNMRTQAC
ncbi:MAG: hypothetical protein KDD53_06130 [Bdellovibrionales bacterium]|nr:hypothetical protein [Bdellovibrionales bacterium]